MIGSATPMPVKRPATAPNTIPPMNDRMLDATYSSGVKPRKSPASASCRDALASNAIAEDSADANPEPAHERLDLLPRGVVLERSAALQPAHAEPARDA